MLVAVGTLATGLAGCGSNNADASGKITAKTSATAPCSKTPTTDHPVPGVALQNWNKTCDAPAILSAYRTFLATYNQVWNDPFGNGLTPTQELGQIYQQVQSGTYPQTSLPPGCALPPPAATPQALPPACQPLVTSTTTTGPLAWATTQLSKVATPVAVSSIVQSLANYVGQGTPKGQLSDLGYAVVRQYATSGSINASAPDLNNDNPWAVWSSKPDTQPTNGLPTAFIWGCVHDSTTVVGADGQPIQGSTPAGPAEFGGPMVRQGTGWLFTGYFTIDLHNPAKSADPCGAGF
jgi:hypothetical protein